MSDAIQRAVRTFFQAFIGVLIASGILSAVEETGVVDWSNLKKVGLSALVAGVVAIVSYIQNALEDVEVIPTFLKDE